MFMAFYCSSFIQISSSFHPNRLTIYYLLTTVWPEHNCTTSTDGEQTFLSESQHAAQCSAPVVAANMETKIQLRKVIMFWYFRWIPHLLQLSGTRSCDITDAKVTQTRQKVLIVTTMKDASYGCKDEGNDNTVSGHSVISQSVVS